MREKMIEWDRENERERVFLLVRPSGDGFYDKVENRFLVQLFSSPAKDFSECLSLISMLMIRSSKRKCDVPMFIIVCRYYFRKIVDDWDSFLIRSIRRSGKFPQKFLKERKDRKYVDVRLCVYS